MSRCVSSALIPSIANSTTIEVFVLLLSELMNKNRLPDACYLTKFEAAESLIALI